MIFKPELSPQNFHYDVPYPLYSASDDVKQKSNVVKIAIFLFQSLTTAGTIWHIKKIGSIFYTSADGYLLIPCTNLCFDKILYGGKLRTINVVSLITYNELECKKRIPSSFLFPNTLARTDLLCMKNAGTQWTIEISSNE